MNASRYNLRRSRALLPALALLLGACATVPPGAANPKDPFQGFNRAVYKFNDTADTYVLKPVAQGYRFAVPEFARIGIRNFFSNLNDVTVTVNDLLQGKIRQGGHDALRFTLNTTIGLLGFVDVATRAGFEKHNEDFGQTLGVWGVGPGPYLVLPILGSSTLRDTVAIPGDWPESPYVRFQHVSVAHRNESYVLSAVSTREGLLDTSDLLSDATLSNDTYNFVRDAWLQRRQNLVYDGHPPEDPDDLDDDPGDADPGAAAKQPTSAPATPPDPATLPSGGPAAQSPDAAAKPNAAP